MLHYKVLVDGKSAHGGDLVWSLPTQDSDGSWQPGEWHVVKPPIEVCERGLHLTTDPMQWPKVGMQVYAAEGDGESDSLDDKTAYERARLLAPADDLVPDYWRKVESFIRDDISAVRWFEQHEAPLPEWRLFTAPSLSAAESAAESAARLASHSAAYSAARLAAYSAAYSAARLAAYSAARLAVRLAAESAAESAARLASHSAAYLAARSAAESAAYSAVLYAATLVCGGLPLDQRHIDYARARWEVWTRGYALLCDVDGVLYVYGVEGKGALA